MAKVRRQFTILGCASSPGVPRINGEWGRCDPTNPKNRRTRAAMMVRQIAEDGGETVVVVDTGPDFRQQMISAEVREIDAVLYTHAHADHLHGIDDLRGFTLTQRRGIPIFAEPETMRRIRGGFAYCFETPAGSAYPPIIDARLIEDLDATLTIDGQGGPVTVQPLRQQHGSITSLGYRFGEFAYCCDVSDFPRETIGKLDGLEHIVIDSLQYKPHPSHLSIDQALWWIEKLGARNAILTHMHIPLDYETVRNETPAHVEPAYDGLTIEYEVEI